MKGTPSHGKKTGKINMIKCRRCGRGAYHVRKKKCASCGFGNSARMRTPKWEK